MLHGVTNVLKVVFTTDYPFLVLTAKKSEN